MEKKKKWSLENEAPWFVAVTFNYMYCTAISNFGHSGTEERKSYKYKSYDGMFILKRSSLYYEYIVAISWNNKINHQPWCKMLLLASSYNMCFFIDGDTRLNEMMLTISPY